MNLARRVSVSFVLVVVFLGISSTANAQLHNIEYTAMSPYQSAAIIARDIVCFATTGST
jgi:hypothetical protein